MKLCLTNLTNLTIVVKHKLTTFVKHLTIIVKQLVNNFRQQRSIRIVIVHEPISLLYNHVKFVLAK